MSPAHLMHHVLIKELGLVDYATTLAQMRRFTQQRTDETLDEIWFLEHHPVFTQGQAGKPEHVLLPGDIPIVQSCRGGQVTYHGPGQLTVYLLLDIARKALGVRCLVEKLEQVVIDLLHFYEINGQRRDNAPGVYIQDQKICSIGLRVSKGRCYHGISFNVNMDLAPFTRINPCGFKNLTMTHLNAFVPGITVAAVTEAIRNLLLPALNYDQRFVYEPL